MRRLRRADARGADARAAVALAAVHARAFSDEAGTDADAASRRATGLLKMDGAARAAYVSARARPWRTPRRRIRGVLRASVQGGERDVDARAAVKPLTEAMLTF